MRRPRKLVLVEWVDSHSGGGGWQPLDSFAEAAAPVHCRSVGWLVAEADGTKVLVANLSGLRDENLRPFGKGDIAIPDRAITKMTVLRSD